jgi:hypothetical protein
MISRSLEIRRVRLENVRRNWWICEEEENLASITTI